MGLFRYEAVDKTGKVVHGAMNAQDEQQVSQKLVSMGYTARAVHPAYAPQDAPAGQTVTQAPTAPRKRAAQPNAGIQSVTVASGVPVSIKSRVGLSELARFFRHMATLVKSGIPVGQALHDMTPAVKNRHLNKVLPRIQEATQGGNTMSGLMAEHPDVFPVHTIASIYAGEMAGKLEIALDEVATDLENEARDTRLGRIGWGIFKINLLFSILLLPAVNLNNIFGPAAKASISSGGNITTGQVLRVIFSNLWHEIYAKSLPVMIATIIIWIIWGVLKRIPTVRRLLDGLVLATPGWGALHRDRAIGRFLHVLDGLNAAGISPGAAWDAASLTPKNSCIAEKLRLARGRLSQNASVSEIMAAAGVIAPEDVALIASGEKTGQVPEVLANLSRAYLESASSKRNVLMGIAITVMITLLIIIGGGMMLAAVKTYYDSIFNVGGMFGGQ